MAKLARCAGSTEFRWGRSQVGRSEVANLALSLNTLRQIEFYDGQNVTEKGSALIAAVTFNVVFDF